MAIFVKFIQRLLQIDIIKVFSLNILASFVKTLTVMISTKVVAVIIGPSGIALIGQLNNLTTILLGLANGGINSGVTKYVAEYKNEELKVKNYISNALLISFFCTFVVSLILVIFCKKISTTILLNQEYYYIFIIFGATILLFTVNSLLRSIINGYKQFGLYVKVSIISSVVGLFYSVFLVFNWGVTGALISIVTFQSIMTFVTLYLCRNMPWMKLDYYTRKLNGPIVRQYIGYSMMTFTSLALQPVCQMFLRSHVITTLSATDAGIWEGMNRISGWYLSIIIAAFSIYYLPRLSEISEPDGLRDEIFRCYKIIIPLLVFISIFIFFIKHFILWLLFSPVFYPMEDLFGWQLTGDIFKIASWLLAYIMIAKAKTLLFISTEIVFSLFYLGISYYLFHINGIIGLTQGYLFNYILYTATMVFVFRNILMTKNK